MKKYTINGKEYSEFEINKRCAELMGFNTSEFNGVLHVEGERFGSQISSSGSYVSNHIYSPIDIQSDAWPIIEKAFDELNEQWLDYDGKTFVSLWQFLIRKHNCSKLVAACICFIESESNDI